MLKEEQKNCMDVKRKQQDSESRNVSFLKETSTWLHSEGKSGIYFVSRSIILLLGVLPCYLVESLQSYEATVMLCNN